MLRNTCVLITAISFRTGFGFVKSPRVLGTQRSFCIATTKKFETEFQPFVSSFPQLNEHQFEQLHDFCYEVSEWNTKVNLISRKDIDNLVVRHLMPSLSIGLIQEFLPTDSVIDVGTGGGFPGIPLAIAFPHTSFTLLDSSSKKMGIVESIVRKLKLQNVEVVAKRAEEHKNQTFNFILGRAVSSLPSFLGWTSHLISRRNDNAHGGVVYLTGGDVTSDLRSLAVNTFSRRNVSDLVRGLESDKYVLRIPTGQVPVIRGRRRFDPLNSRDKLKHE